jgi:hypothetical protein
MMLFWLFRPLRPFETRDWKLESFAFASSRAPSVENQQTRARLPFDNFNIDHVIVGPPGVYAIETKTRRKPIGDKGKAAHKVIFDGGALHYPWGKDTHGLEQAKRNADHLASWLSSATGEKVRVEAILTLPGWWIDRTARGAVHVVNTKEIPKIFTGKSAPTVLAAAADPTKNHEPETKNSASRRFPLSPEQIQRISHQIEQKCRNVEG